MMDLGQCLVCGFTVHDNDFIWFVEHWISRNNEDKCHAGISFTA